MAPVKKGDVGDGAAAGGEVVQREIKGDVQFSYAESDIESTASQSRSVAEPLPAGFQGQAPPGLSTEHLAEIERAHAKGLVPRNVIGDDGREYIKDTTINPYKSICLLEMVSPNGTPLMGTGWLCGNSTLVTAGHCVYSHNSREGIGAMRSIKVYAGRNKNVWLGEAVATATNTTKEWLDGASEKDDYAVVQLSKPLGEQLGVFLLAEYPDSVLQSLLVSVAGYPSDKNSKIETFGQMWGCANKITTVSDQRLSYLVDTVGGESGSAVMLFDGNVAYALGIHNYGGSSANFATRINTKVFDKISGWLK